MKNAAISLIIIGVILSLVGLFISVPGEQLTTYSFMHDSSYSVIEEYVGGDAYNFIIGACLVGGKIAGTLAMKAVFIAVGILIFCIGIVSYSFGSMQGAQETQIKTTAYVPNYMSNPSANAASNKDDEQAETNGISTN